MGLITNLFKKNKNEKQIVFDSPTCSNLVHTNLANSNLKPFTTEDANLREKFAPSMTEDFLCNLLNGKYDINDYKVTIDYPHSFACFESNKDGVYEVHAFQGDEGDKVIKEISLTLNTLTKEESIEKWINLNLLICLDCQL